MATLTADQEYDAAERELVGLAVSQTEDEIAKSAFDAEEPENDGDTSLEEMDGDDVPDDDSFEDGDEDEGDVEASAGDDEPEPEPEPVRQQGIPSARLKAEADARRAAEAEAAAMRAEMAALRAEMQAARQPRQQPQEAPRPAEPDMFGQPDEWKAHLLNAVIAKVEERRVNTAMEEAKRVHGSKFDAAWSAAERAIAAGDTSVSQIARAYDPGKALLDWHDRQTLLQEVRDPAAYRERIRQELLNDPEVRQQLVGELRGQAGTRVKLPPSLARGGNGAGANASTPPARRVQSTRSVEEEIARSPWE